MKPKKSKKMSKNKLEKMKKIMMIQQKKCKIICNKETSKKIIIELKNKNLTIQRMISKQTMSIMK